MDMLNLSPNERLDLADLTYATFDSQLGLHRNITGQILTNPNAVQPAFVLSGFGVTNPAGSQVAVTRGVALLPYRQGAEVLFGLVACEGPQTQTLDLSSRAAGTYTIYISFSYQPGALDTRTLWTPDNGGAEYSQSVPTRMVAGWQMVAESVSPGVEWLPIATVTLPSMAIVDMRPLYFEGRPDQGFAPQWGSDADRDANRALAPIADMQTFVQAVQQCLIDVKGPGIADWFTPYVAGQTIGFAGTAQPGATAWADAGFYALGDAQMPHLGFSADGAQFGYDRSSGAFSLVGGAAASSTQQNYSAPGASAAAYATQTTAASFALADLANDTKPIVYTAANQTLDLSAGGTGAAVLPPPGRITYASPQTVSRYLPILEGRVLLGVPLYPAGPTYTNDLSVFPTISGQLMIGFSANTQTNAIGATWMLPVSLPGACTITQIEVNHRTLSNVQGALALMKKPNVSFGPNTATVVGSIALVARSAFYTGPGAATGYTTIDAAFNEAVAAADLNQYFLHLSLYNYKSPSSTDDTLSTAGFTLDYVRISYTLAGPAFGARG